MAISRAIWFTSRATPLRAFTRARFWKAGLTRGASKISGTSCARARLLVVSAPVADAGFLEVPDVSMGLGPINAIYQARFMRYLENRGLIPRTPRKSGPFWAMAKWTSPNRWVR